MLLFPPIFTEEPQCATLSKKPNAFKGNTTFCFRSDTIRDLWFNSEAEQLQEEQLWLLDAVSHLASQLPRWCQNSYFVLEHAESGTLKMIWWIDSYIEATCWRSSCLSGSTGRKYELGYIKFALKMDVCDADTESNVVKFCQRQSFGIWSLFYCHFVTFFSWEASLCTLY